MFLGAIRLSIPNRIAIGSAVYAQFLECISGNGGNGRGVARSSFWVGIFLYYTILQSYILAA